MAVAEQLHIHLKAGEKSALSEAARRQNLSISAYIRNRLFGPSLSQADQVLMEELAALCPRFEAALKVINANMADIADLRPKIGEPPIGSELLPDESELLAIAEHLNLSQEETGVGP